MSSKTLKWVSDPPQTSFLTPVLMWPNFVIKGYILNIYLNTGLKIVQMLIKIDIYCNQKILFYIFKSEIRVHVAHLSFFSKVLAHAHYYHPVFSRAQCVSSAHQDMAKEE